MITASFRSRGPLVLAVLALVACGDSDVPAGPSLPPHIAQAINDPRIGAGIPAQYRVAGTEHNRLTLLVARRLRAEGRSMRDPVHRCAAIRRELMRESPNTARRIGVEAHLDLLRTSLDAELRRHPGCGTGLIATSASLVTGPPAAAFTEGDTLWITAAAIAVLDQFEADISAATSMTGIHQAMSTAAAAVPGFGEADAAAISAAVAEAQASMVLWGPGGAGWEEIKPTTAYESIFPRTRDGELTDWQKFKLSMAADVGGCVGAIKFLRQLPIVQDPRLLLGACGLVAAGGSLIMAYELYHQ